MDLTGLQRRKHGAARFMLVHAVAELATGHQCCEFRKIRIYFFRFGIPQSQRLPSGRIRQIATAFELEQLPYNGCVFSLIYRCADFAHRQSKSGLDAVEQTRFPCAARTGHGADLARQPHFELIQAVASFGRSVDYRITKRLIISKDLLGFVTRSILLATMMAGTRSFLRDDQEPVEHPQFWIWLCAGKNEYGLVWICKQDLLIYPLGPRVQPDDRPFSFFDFFYHSRSVC